MAIDILNKRSKDLNDDGSPKLPSAEDLKYGQIAINYAKGKETIAIKNDQDEVVSINSGIKGVKVGSNTTNESVANGIVTIANADGTKDGTLTKQSYNSLKHRFLFADSEPKEFYPSGDYMIVALDVINPITSSSSSTMHIRIPFATDSYSGVMSYSDKTKLDSIINTGDGTKFLADNFTYKSIAATDIPDLSNKYLPLSGGTMTGPINITWEGIKTNQGTNRLLFYNDNEFWLGANVYRTVLETSNNDVLHRKNDTNYVMYDESNFKAGVQYIAPGEIQISEVNGLQTALDNKVSSSALNEYLPLSGGMMTGNVRFSNNSSVYLNSGSAIISYFGNDSYPILYGDSENNRTVLGTVSKATQIRSNSSITRREGNGSEYTVYDSGNFVAGTNYVAPNTVYTKEEIDGKGYQTASQVQSAISALVDSAPETLNTLNELAAALGDDPNFATTVSNEIGTKADKVHTHTLSQISDIADRWKNALKYVPNEDYQSINGQTYGFARLENDNGVTNWADPFSIYAPTTAGTEAGLILESNGGTSAPTWASFFDKEQDEWYYLTSYKYDTDISPNCIPVWNKICNLGMSGTHYAVLRVQVLNDVNFPSISEWLLQLSSYNDVGSKNISLTPTSTVSNGLKLGVDSGNNLWMECNAQWTSFLRFKFEYRKSDTFIYKSDWETMLNTDVTDDTFTYIINNIGSYRNGSLYQHRELYTGYLTNEYNKYVLNASDKNGVILGNSTFSYATLLTADGGKIYHKNATGNNYEILDTNNFGSITFTGAATGTFNGTNDLTINIPSQPSLANYATKTELSEGLAGKANTSHTHTASQVSGLATVATSGSYNDLSNKPTIPSLSGYATQTWANGQFYPLNGKGYMTFDTNGRPVMDNNQGYSCKKADGTAIEVLWINPSNTLLVGGTSSSSLGTIQFQTDNLVTKSGKRVAFTSDIPTIPTLSGGASATSGQYVSGVTVSGHTVTVTKASLPTVTLSSLGVTATAAELNKLDGCTVTTTELNYVDGVTSNIQTQLNGKAASSHTHSNYATTDSVSSAISEASYNTGHNQVSSLSNVPTTKRLVIAGVNSSQSFSCGTIADGRELHVVVYNVSSSDIIITLPTSMTVGYVNLVGDSLTVKGNSYAEINVISDGSDKYIRAI